MPGNVFWGGYVGIVSDPEGNYWRFASTPFYKAKGQPNHSGLLGYIFYISGMNADDYETAFHGIELPATAELFPGTIVSDVPKFISASVLILKAATNPRQVETAKYRLDRLLEMIRKGLVY